MKVVINCCYGGYGLSLEARKRILDIKGVSYEIKRYTEYDGRLSKDEDLFGLDGKHYGRYSPIFSDLERHDPILVQVVEELKEKAGDWASKLEIVEIPDDVKYTIEEYDGYEHVAEAHRTWP